MRLNDEQKRIVEENHNLIYWIAHSKGLEIDEWYGLLAMELCMSVISYDESKGSLSNYYKIRCDNLVMKEYKKSMRQKRVHNGLQELNHDYPIDDNIDYSIHMAELMDNEHADVIKLKLDGYTQNEISDILGISQSKVSKIMKKVRKNYER
jgi:RNA polymerase sigma factor (sigma-70 family)